MARNLKLTSAAVVILAATWMTIVAVPAALSETKPAQEARGTIIAPARAPGDPNSSGAGGHRMGPGAIGLNGQIGYTFGIARVTWGGRYDLDVISGASGREDLDIDFYVSIDPLAPAGAADTRAIGGESGVVPNGSRYAIVVMFEGADAAFRYRGWAPTSRSPNTAIVAEPGIYPNFGRESESLARRLRSRSHVVIAVVDTGINPYHVAFRRPEYVVHPSEYIDGFPRETRALGLSLGDRDYVAARRRDDRAVWSRVETRTPYWIPGTNIIGAYADHEYSSGEPVPSGVNEPRPILDENGHGTASASVAAGGSTYQRRTVGTNPEALLVIVEGIGADAIEWVSRQPWIDFISASYGVIAGVPTPKVVHDVSDRSPEPAQSHHLMSREYPHTDRFVRRDGRTACVAAGNGVSGAGVAPDRSTSLTATAGPSWVVTVGAVSPHNEQATWWHSVPADVSSYGNLWPAATAYSTNGETIHAGTSNATPLTCGVFSRVLLDARRSLHDTREGIHVLERGGRAQAVGHPNTAAGLLADGRLTREELEAAVLKTAYPSAFEPQRFADDPRVYPDSPLYYTVEGYGVVNAASAKRASGVVHGRAAMPQRPDVDAWFTVMDAARDALYPPDGP